MALHPKVRLIASQISTLPGFGVRNLHIIISCDCNEIADLREGARLQGHVIRITYCLNASLLGLGDQLVDWSLNHNVDISLDCRFGVAYTPILNI